MKTASIEEEYKKNDKLKKEDVDALMHWVEKQDYLPKITELEAILFLHSTFYRTEAAKNVIDTYYTCRTHAPEFFKNRDPNGSLVKDMTMVTFYTLPTPTPIPENYKFVYVRLNDKDLGRFNFPEYLKMFCMYVDLWLLQEGTAPGHAIVIDMHNMTFGHLAKLSMCLVHIKKFFLYLQEGIPFRLVGVHVIHVVPFIDKVMALLKPFMKKELLDVIVFHTEGMDSLYKVVPKRCLPQHLEGEGASLLDMNDSMKKYLQDEADYFKEELSQRVDESKRPGKPKTTGDIFGMEGSFKKLDID